MNHTQEVMWIHICYNVQTDRGLAIRIRIQEASHNTNSDANKNYKEKNKTKILWKNFLKIKFTKIRSDSCFGMLFGNFSFLPDFQIFLPFGSGSKSLLFMRIHVTAFRYGTCLGFWWHTASPWPSVRSPPLGTRSWPHKNKIFVYDVTSCWQLTETKTGQVVFVC